MSNLPPILSASHLIDLAARIAYSRHAAHRLTQSPLLACGLLSSATFAICLSRLAALSALCRYIGARVADHCPRAHTPRVVHRSTSLQVWSSGGTQHPAYTSQDIPELYVYYTCTPHTTHLSVRVPYVMCACAPLSSLASHVNSNAKIAIEHANRRVTSSIDVVTGTVSVQVVMKQ